MTSDIAYAFGTPPSDAEAIKVRHGCALGSIVGKDESVEVPSVGGRPPRSLQRQTLAEVIEPRYTELLNLVNEEILQLQEKLRQQGVKHHLAAGIVLTVAQRRSKVLQPVLSACFIRKCVSARR